MVSYFFFTGVISDMLSKIIGHFVRFYVILMYFWIVHFSDGILL